MLESRVKAGDWVRVEETTIVAGQWMLVKRKTKMAARKIQIDSMHLPKTGV